ncbi:MAG: glycosyltransferase family 39 protein [Burkholderiales bacterium]|nr:glycosyltransferase family 39 protein [Phycisphaerae bacterium]
MSVISSEINPAIDHTSIAAPARNYWLDLAIIFVIVCAVFAAVVPGPYAHMDDTSMLRDNVRYLDPSWSNFVKHYTDPAFNIFAPLTYSVWHVIAYFVLDLDAPTAEQRMPPTVFKTVSVLVHAASAIAAWRVLRHLTEHRWAPVLGALAFALHPIQVESVAWTTGLKDELCGLFSFLAIASYLSHFRSNRRRDWVLTFLFVIAATLSKPTGVILPLTLFLVDCLVTNRSMEQRFRLAAPFIFPAVISGAVMMHIQTPTNLYSPLWARPLIAADAIAYYLYKIILPINLVPDYARAPDVIIDDRSIFWTWIIPAIVGALLLRFGSRRLKLAAVLLVMPLLPVSGLLRFDMQQYSTVTDHYLYQSLLGVGLVMMLIAERATIHRAAVCVVLGIMSVLTVFQITRWWDQRALQTHNAQLQPKSLMSYAGLASRAIRDGDFEQAERHARRAIAIRPRPVEYNNLSQLLMAQNRYAESSEAGRRALDLGLCVPDSLRLLLLRSTILKDRELAKLTLERWVSVDPKNPKLRIMLDAIALSAATQPTTMSETGTHGEALGP